MGMPTSRLALLGIPLLGCLVAATKPATRAAPVAPPPPATTAASQPAGLPDQASIAKATTLLRQLFKSDYAALGQTERQAFARKLLQQGIDTADDVPARYVLFCESRDIAAAASDALTAMRAIDQLAASFPVDAHEMKLASLAVAGRFADTVQLEAVFQCALSAINAAVADDRYDIAARFCALAEGVATRAHKANLIAQAQQRGKDLAAQKQEYEEAKAALEMVARNPDDPAARTTAGRFLCFVKGDWATGLRLLAGCSDTPVKALAERDRLNPADAAAQAQLADDWWDYAEKLPPSPRQAVQARAGVWYRKALPKLTGVTRTKAESRLADISAAEMKRLHLEPGLAADLFSDKDLTHKSLSRVDPQIDFDWGAAAPADGVPKTQFSIRWTGHLRVTTAGRHTLAVSANDGARLFIDDKLILDAPEAWRKRTGERITVDLTEGFHSIRIEYWKGPGVAHMKLLWQAPGMKAEEPIPASALCHDPLAK